jgi:hypothetical protein
MNVLQLSGLLVAGDAAFAASIWAVTMFFHGRATRPSHTEYSTRPSHTERAARNARVWEKHLRGETVTLDAFVAGRGLRVRETRPSLMPLARALPEGRQTATNAAATVLVNARGDVQVQATAPALDPRLRDALVAMGFRAGQVDAVLRGMGRETGTGPGTDFQAQIKTALGRLAK